MDQHTLAQLLGKYHEIEARLIESDGVITPEIEAAIAAVEDSIGQKLDGYAGFIGYLKGQVEYLKTEADQYTARARTLTCTIEALRERMIYAMSEIGESKVKTAKHSYSLRETESWAISDTATDGERNALVAAGLARYDFKADMKAIKDAFKGKELPEYVVVTAKASITIR